MSNIQKQIGRHKISILFALVLSFGGVQHAFADILSPGTITTCGEIATTGTYTLGNNIGTSTGACLVITSGGAVGDTIIDGNNFSLTGDIDGNGVNAGDPGHNFTLQNIIINGTTTANGADTGGACIAGGAGGSISLINASSSSIYANGGDETYPNPGCELSGAGGTISISKTNLNLSNITISAAPGGATDPNNANTVAGTIVLQYSTFTHTNLLFSSFTSVTLNGPGNQPGNVGAFSAGLFPAALPGDTIGSASACDLVFAGTYTLSANIASCVIRGDGVILDGGNNGSGGHYKITGNVSGNGLLQGDPGHNFTLQNIDVVGSITSNGLDHTSGTCNSSQTPMYGGTINILNASTSNITANGGTDSIGGCYSGGNGGVITVSTSTTGTLTTNAGNILNTPGTYGGGMITVTNSTVGAITANGGFDTAGTISIYNSTTSSITANGDPNSTLNAGSVTVSTSTIGAITVNGYINNAGNPGEYGGNGGTVNITASHFSTIDANGDIGTGYLSVPGSGGNVTVTDTVLNLNGVTITTLHGYDPNNGDPTPGVLDGSLTLNFSSIAAGTIGYFNFIHSLVVNGYSYGSWNGAFNANGFYFNDTVAGAGHDGNWNNAANWWTDVGFTSHTGSVPLQVNNTTIYSDVTQNTGGSAVSNALIFNGGAKNHIAIYASSTVTFNATSSNYGTILGDTTFNDSSANYGTTTGETIFAGNSSENYGAVVHNAFTSVESARDWRGVVSSFDGRYLAAVVYQDHIYVSNDYGATWTARGSSGNWIGITASVDGSKLAAVNYGGQVYVSNDYGVSWIAGGPSTTWQSVTSSGDGMKIAAINASHQVYISTDNGQTWALSTTTNSNTQSSIKYSADGAKLYISLLYATSTTYVSTDDGTTWTTVDASHAWRAISADGTKIVSVNYATSSATQVYTSTDSGATWTPRMLPGFWGNFSASSDGSKIAAIKNISGNNYQMYTSTDYGVTWTARDINRRWSITAISGNGQNIAAVGFLSNIYTWLGINHFDTPIRKYMTDTNVGSRNFTNTGTNWVVQAVSSVVDISSATYNTTNDFFESINGGSFITNPSINGGAPVVPLVSILAPLSGTITKWVPQVDWGSSALCRYSYDNFSTSHVVNCALSGTDIVRPAVAGTSTLYLRGTDANSNVAATSVTFNYDNTVPTYTLCGTDLLDEASRPYYYLISDVTGNCIFRVNTELRGAATSSVTGFTVHGNIIATSTGDGITASGDGHSISLTNITVEGTVNANGYDLFTHGSGFNGGNITLTDAVTGSIYANGASALSLGGSGGNITIHNSTQIAASTTISAIGGTPQCGAGGPGGNVSLVNSIYDIILNGPGADVTCTSSGATTQSYSGSSGSVSIVGKYAAPGNDKNDHGPKKSPVAAPLAVVEQNTQSSVSSSVVPPVTTINSKETGVVQTNALDKVRSFISGTAQKITETAVVVANSPAAKTVQTVGFFGGLAASVAFYTDSAFATPVAASEVLLIPVRLWGLLLAGLGIRKRLRPWGTVYDSVTKQPIDPAFVTARDASGKVVAESFTDIDGRYGFLLPDGTYYISAQKTNYEFPSKKMEGKHNDELYNDLYFGEPVVIQGGQVLDKNIPMDQKNFDWNEYAKQRRNALLFHTKHEKPWAVISNYVYGVGLAISVIATAIHPTTYNIVILLSYIAVLISFNFTNKKKKLGSIINKDTNQPLSYAIFRVTSSDHQTILRSGVSDVYGRFYCIVPKGQYYIDIDQKNEDGTYTKVYESVLLNNKTGYINSNFVV
ncbi:MAG TPA: hypothetical protein VL335_00020 [Candidatus Paceibacterota bacterium]|jgi:hypothetical protein|nr:hypothetical protein [Candidatus Paceibacterota bacterium]